MEYGDGNHPPIKGLDSLRPQMRNWMNASKAAFCDFKLGDVTAAASGETVLVWSQTSGVWKGFLMGQKPTRKPFKMYGVDYFILNDAGKIIEHRATPGDAELARQTGMKM